MSKSESVLVNSCTCVVVLLLVLEQIRFRGFWALCLFGTFSVQKIDNICGGEKRRGKKRKEEKKKKMAKKRRNEWSSLGCNGGNREDEEEEHAACPVPGAKHLIEFWSQCRCSKIV